MVRVLKEQAVVSSLVGLSASSREAVHCSVGGRWFRK